MEHFFHRSSGQIIFQTRVDSINVGRVVRIQNWHQRCNDSLVLINAKPGLFSFQKTEIGIFSGEKNQQQRQQQHQQQPFFL